MGPTNKALVNLFLTDRTLREAQGRLADVTRNVRLQERKVTDLTARESTAKHDLMKLKARAGELDLEIKSRDARIEQFRTQQQQAQTNKEYQTFLVQINTQKVDKAKFEEEALDLIEKIEKLAADHKSLITQRDSESVRHVTMNGEIDTKVKQLNSEIDSLRPARDLAAEAVPEKARVIFDRLAERYDGEPLESIDKPHPKREEYIATICNIDLTVDVYNRLHSRDELIFCPGCGRILYIPDHLTLDKAVHKPKEKKPHTERKTAGPKKPRVKKGDLAAPIGLQTLAGSVVGSVDRDEPAIEAPSSADIDHPVSSTADTDMSDTDMSVTPAEPVNS